MNTLYNIYDSNGPEQGPEQAPEQAQLTFVHNNVQTILINTTSNRYNSMKFIQKNIQIVSDLISTQFIVNYNKTNIFDFIICSNIHVSYLKSSHDSFNFCVRSEYIIETNKFIDKIGLLVLSIINNHNLIRSVFKIIKPFDIADKIYLDTKTNIYIKIEADKYILNIDNNKHVYSDFKKLVDNVELHIYKKITLKTIIKYFC